MERRARNLLVFLLTIVTTSCLFAQSKSIDFNGPPLMPESRKHFTIREFLEQNVEQPKGEDCTRYGFGFFYFRLNSNQKIDSIFMQGNLSKKVERSIKKNIKASEKYWDLSSIEPKDKIWLIYPYFDLGGASFDSNNCSESQKIVQRYLIMLVESISSATSDLNTQEYFILLKPSKKGGPYIEM